MTIRFNLKDAKAKTSPIRLVLSQQGVVYRKNIGIVIPTSTWNTNKQQCTNTKVNQCIVAIRYNLESRLDKWATREEIEAALNKIQDGKWIDLPPTRKEINLAPTTSFWDYFRQWSELPSPAKRNRTLAYRKIAEIMGTKDTWESVDSSFYFRLTKEMDTRGYGKNYQASIISKLKTVMSEGYKLHLHRNDDYHSFKKPSEDTFAIALTREELDTMWSLDLKGLQAQARDFFMLGTLTASRFEDTIDLTKENIHGSTIEFIQKKTGVRVVIPCSPKVKTILARNEGKAPQVNQVVYNRTLKILGLKARMLETMQVPTPVRKRLKKGEKEAIQRYELLTGHCARRTGATLLYLSGVPMRQVMLITGHKTEAAFSRYIRVNQSENAKMLKGNLLFQ